MPFKILEAFFSLSFKKLLPSLKISRSATEEDSIFEAEAKGLRDLDVLSVFLNLRIALSLSNPTLLNRQIIINCPLDAACAYFQNLEIVFRVYTMHCMRSVLILSPNHS